MIQPSRPAKVDSHQVLHWLVDWFEKRSGTIGQIEQNHTVNYIEMGLIDSMGLMELIGGLEGAFGVRYTETHFQDPRFATIQGLSELTAELAGQIGAPP